MVAARARRPGHVRAVDRARLDRLGRSAAYLPSGPHQRRAGSLQGTGDPALELLRGTGTIAPAPVWVGALCGLVFGWRARDRTVAALASVAAAWVGAHRRGTALGYPAVPRYLVVPVAICCVLAGIGAVAVVRLASAPRGRAVLAVALVAV